MALLETAVAAVGRLALAAAYNGPAPRRQQPQRDEDETMRGPSVADGEDEPRPTPNEGEAIANVAPRLQEAAVYVSAGLAWLGERNTLTRHTLDHDARAAVLIKDLLVAGSVITGLASLAGEALLAQQSSPPRSGDTEEQARSGADEGGSYRRYLTVMTTVNHAFVAGAIAATPFINFALFNAYKPHPIRSFFKL